MPSGVVAELFEDPTATEEVTSDARGSEEGAIETAPRAREAGDESATVVAAPAKRGRKKKGDDAGGPGLPGVE